jgi:hypothetical protein
MTQTPTGRKRTALQASCQLSLLSHHFASEPRSALSILSFSCYFPPSSREIIVFATGKIGGQKVTYLVRSWGAALPGRKDDKDVKWSNDSPLHVLMFEPVPDLQLGCVWDCVWSPVSVKGDNRRSSPATKMVNSPTHLVCVALIFTGASSVYVRQALFALRCVSPQHPIRQAHFGRRPGAESNRQSRQLPATF